MVQLIKVGSDEDPSLKIAPPLTDAELLVIKQLIKVADDALLHIAPPLRAEL